MSTSRFQWTPFPDGTGASLSGDVDEFSRLVERGAELKAPRLRFDLGGIRRINSLGVRQWIQLVRSLHPRPVRLERCPAVMVEQLNYLKDFRGHAEVGSMLLPYSCDACNARIEREVAADSLRGLPELPAGPPCDRCGRATELDDFPERYLSLTR